MNELKGVFLDLSTLDRGDLDLSSLKGTLGHWELFDATRTEETAARIRDAEVVVSNKVVLDRARLTEAHNLKLVCVAATGTNNVDLAAARELDIAVTNVAGYATASVVQTVFSQILALTMHLSDYQRLVADGAWQRSSQFCLLDFPFREICDKTLGIVGYGELGRAVAKVAEAFGMRVLISERPGGPPQAGRLPLDELLAEVDVLSLHCPLAENTRNLIGARELELMKPDALLINAARGGIVDEKALAEALRAGRLGGAGVDVLCAEPPTQGNPLLEPGIPNLIVTPHIAWTSREARQRLADEVAENIRAFLAGEKRNRV